MWEGGEAPVGYSRRRTLILAQPARAQTWKMIDQKREKESPSGVTPMLHGMSTGCIYTDVYDRL